MAPSATIHPPTSNPSPPTTRRTRSLRTTPLTPPSTAVSTSTTTATSSLYNSHANAVTSTQTSSAHHLPHEPGPPVPSLERNIDTVVFGHVAFEAWYPSWYPKEVVGESKSLGVGGAADGNGSGEARNGDGKIEGRSGAVLKELYVCNRCFKYERDVVKWVRHGRVCEVEVPGRRIYVHGQGEGRGKGGERGGSRGRGRGRGRGRPRGLGVGGGRGASVTREDEVKEEKEEGVWSIWEVDGEVETLFCQNLSLFAKLFLDNKSVFFDVSGFNYFLLVHTPPTTSFSSTSPTDSSSPQVVGFFSKEKMSWDNNNLACILVFPPWQRKGLGAMLMGVSYEISRREEIMGGPEKPISELGRKGYRRYWGAEVARWILGYRGEGRRGWGAVDVERISRETWIAAEDVLGVVREMDIVERVDVDGSKVGRKGDTLGNEEGRENVRVRIDKVKVREWVESQGVSLERVVDRDGFVEGYGFKVVDVGDEDVEMSE